MQCPVFVQLCPSRQLPALHCALPSDARLVMQLARSSKNLVIIFQSRSLALLLHRSFLNLAVQQKKKKKKKKKGLGLT